MGTWLPYLVVNMYLFPVLSSTKKRIFHLRGLWLTKKGFVVDFGALGLSEGLSCFWGGALLLGMGFAYSFFIETESLEGGGLRAPKLLAASANV